MTVPILRAFAVICLLVLIFQGNLSKYCSKVTEYDGPVIKGIFSKHCLRTNEFEMSFHTQLKGLKLTELFEDSSTVLGDGEFGIVKQIEWVENDRPIAVAVKQILIKDFIVENQIKNEVNMLAELKNTGHVINMLGCMQDFSGDEYPGIPPNTPVIYIVFEKLYSDLGDPVAVLKFHLLGTPEKIDIYLKIAQAIQFLHSRAIVHSDLKVENIMITDDKLSQVKLIDFGLSVCSDKLYVGGSLNNVPPEYTTGLIAKSSIDIFGFGTAVVILERSIDELERIASTMMDRLDSLTSYTANALAAQSMANSIHEYHSSDSQQDSLTKIVLECLSVDPSKRPTADQLVERIAAVKNRTTNTFSKEKKQKIQNSKIELEYALNHLNTLTNRNEFIAKILNFPSDGKKTPASFKGVVIKKSDIESEGSSMIWWVGGGFILLSLVSVPVFFYLQNSENN